MSELICRKTMMRRQTPGMCAPHGGCSTSAEAARAALAQRCRELETERDDAKADAVMVRSYEAECLRLIAEVEAERDTLRAEVEALRGELQEERSAAESLRFSAWRHGDFLAVRELLGMFCADGVAGVDQEGMECVARWAAQEFERLRRLNPGDIPTT